jgi:hypothetical protein
MNYYAYDSNAILHYIGDHPSPHFSRRSALELLGHQTLILCEHQIITAAVTARMLAHNATPTEHIDPPKVTKMTTRGGNPAINQYIISDNSKSVYFQSYDTIIALVDRYGRVTLDRCRWNFSHTTSHYRNQFLQENLSQTESKLKSGEYTLANLN